MTDEEKELVRKAKNLAMREWRAKNKEKNRAYQKQYMASYMTAEKKEAARVRARAWYEENKEEAKERILARHHATKVLKGRPTGENHHAWKGDDVGYHALHTWVTRNLGSPAKCSKCGIDDSDKKYHWANVSGEYKRDLSDWARLCVSCHSEHDKRLGFNSIKKKFGTI